MYVYNKFPIIDLAHVEYIFEACDSLTRCRNYKIYGTHCWLLAWGVRIRLQYMCINPDLVLVYKPRYIHIVILVPLLTDDQQDKC